MTVRVALYGNTHNNLYQMAKLLRDELDVDAHLFLPDRNRIQNRPESDDPELKDNYPDWIHVGPYRSAIAQYLPMFSRLVRDVEDFDYIIASQKAPSLAPYMKPKFLFYVTGTDLTRVPFYGRCWRWYRGLPAKLASQVRVFWQRRGLSHVHQIWAQPFRPMLSAINDLELETYNRGAYFPVVVDDFPPSCQGIEHLLDEVKQNWDFTVFNPAQLLLDDTPDMVATGVWKNNLALLYGFARFVKQTGAKRTALMVVERGNNLTEKAARERFKQVAEELGIGDRLVFLKPPAPQDVFTRAQIFSFYDSSDVIGVDYGVGWFGSIVIEGLSLAKPVISYVEESVMLELYGDHPLINVREPDEIGDALTRLYKDSDYRFKVGQKGQAWYKKHHSPQGAKHRYIENLKFLRPNDAKSSNGTENSN